MPRILKRPMFSRGGSTNKNDGIMTGLVDRKGFENGTKDPSEVVAGMDNELNPSKLDQMLGIFKGGVPDIQQGEDLINIIQDYKYGKSYPGETVMKKDKNKNVTGLYPQQKEDRPPMGIEETIDAMEAAWDKFVEEGDNPITQSLDGNRGGYNFNDMGIFDREDIRRRIELGFDSAKGPESSEGIMTTTAADGGRINKNMGGEFNMPPAGLSSLQTQQSDVTPQGMELDLRGGGFIPIGKAEKADDVPARVSKNEFVFTADAVKAAGGGSVNEGAKKMYDTMKQLESQVG